jgi:putative endonuclease
MRWCGRRWRGYDTFTLNRVKGLAEIAICMKVGTISISLLTVIMLCYNGETDDLKRRFFEHKQRFVKSFSKRYNADKLVYFELADDRLSAVAEEKQIKGWLRAKKIKMIESFNPEWKDLYEEI